MRRIVDRRNPLSGLGIALLAVVGIVGPGTLAAEGDDTLAVGVKVAPPFVEKGEDGTWSGLAVDLWRQIAEREGLAYTLEERDIEGLLADVERGTLDLGVAALTITADRERRVDFTHAYYLAGLGIAVSSESEGGAWNGLRRLLSTGFLRAVGALAAVLLACGLAVWAFERKRNPEQFGGSTLSGIGSGFWWAAVTMTTVGYGDKAPVTTPGRVVALLWMFASLIVISGFTAAIATALTVGSLDTGIQGVSDLSDHRVATVEATAAAEWLDDERIDATRYANVDRALDALRAGTVEAVVYDAPILVWKSRGASGGDFRVLPERFDPQPYGFALGSGDPRREAINRAMLEIVETDAWRDALFDVLGD